MEIKCHRTVLCLENLRPVPPQKKNVYREFMYEYRLVVRVSKIYNDYSRQIVYLIIIVDLTVLCS